MYFTLWFNRFGMALPTTILDAAQQAPTLKGEARRMRILDAAAEAFLELGYADTSMQLIVQRAGGSATTAYQLFGNKEGLLAAVVQRELDRLGAQVFPESLFELPVAQALEGIAERLITYSVQQRSVRFYRLLMAESPRLPQIVADVRNQIETQIHQPLERCLRGACARGELQIDEPARAAMLLGSLVNGIAHEARLSDGYPDGPSPHDREACRYGVQTFLRAFQADAVHPA